MDDWMAEARGYFGQPGRVHPLGGWERVTAALGAQPPADLVRFVDSYGACILRAFFYINHPRSVELDTFEVFDINSDFLRELGESDDAQERIPYPLMARIRPHIQ